jgi:hemolysin III
VNRSDSHTTPRPTWRGWLHAWAFVVSLATGTVLVALADGSTARWATAVYAATVSLLFGTSALYHRVTWSPRMHVVMKRLDHSMIFVFIAGTYTPFSLLVLPTRTAWILLGFAWGAALIGITIRMAWLRSPRWLNVPLYAGVGWIALVILPDLLRHGGVTLFLLLLAGGLLYSVGAVVYALRRPDPVPAVFGYHEVFHACTLVAAVCHYVAVWFALYGGAPTT